MLRESFRKFLARLVEDALDPAAGSAAAKPAPAGDKLFCSRPFKWFEVSRWQEEGEVFVCCPNWLPKPIGNLRDQSVAEIWNGEAAQEIRRGILDGSFSYCEARNCPHLQNLSEPVQRVADVTDPELLKIIEEELTVLPYGPRELNCSYDRSCNLSCPSCRTELIMEHDRADEILAIQRKINDDALADAEMLYITGSGDPFGSPYFRRWLQTMRRSDMPNMQTIHLHTNGLLWTDRTWETIPAEVRALVKTADISIDAARPETYALNRRGGDFERLVRNLEFISGLRADGPLEWFGVNMVVQANNFEEMAEFVALGRRLGCDMIMFNRLVNWGTFSQAEFEDRAVHLPNHPLHGAFLQALQDEALRDEAVYLGNLEALRSAGGAASSAAMVH